MVKHAMIAIDEALRKATANQKLRAKLLLQIHDELILEVPIEEVPNVVGIIRTGMSAALPLSLPLPVTINIGERLGSLMSLSEECLREMQTLGRIPEKLDTQLSEIRDEQENKRQHLSQPTPPSTQ